MSDLQPRPDLRATPPAPKGASKEAPAAARPRGLDGFTPQEWAALVALRERVRRREVHEWSAEDRRLRFARWRYEHGYIDG
jgi:hypothetical protein